MSYETGGIINGRIDDFDGGVIVRATTVHTAKVVQCYVSGVLATRQSPRNGSVRFILPPLRPTDLIFLLAVDAEDSSRDYFLQAFPLAAERGNRILMRTPQVMSYLPGDRWRVYLGDSGQGQAGRLVHERAFYSAGRGCCGLGMSFGGGGFGFDAAGCAGLGRNFGHGEFGFDCEILSWTSPPLPPGTYPVKTVVADAHGNESTAFESAVTLRSPPRAARDLTVAGYASAADTLQLTWTASEDL